MNRRASLTAVAAIVVLAPDATLAATLDGTAMRRPSSAQAAEAHPAKMLLLLQIATAVLSAVLDNVTTP